MFVVVALAHQHAPTLRESFTILLRHDIMTSLASSQTKLYVIHHDPSLLNTISLNEQFITHTYPTTLAPLNSLLTNTISIHRTSMICYGKIYISIATHTLPEDTKCWFHDQTWNFFRHKYYDAHFSSLWDWDCSFSFIFFNLLTKKAWLTLMVDS